MSIVFVFVLFSMFVNVKSKEQTFLLVTNRSVSKIDFDDQTSTLIYSSPSNWKIRSSSFDQRKNLFVILSEENERSIVESFQTKPTWTKISSIDFNSSKTFIFLSEENLYVFDEKTQTIRIGDGKKLSNEFRRVDLPNSLRIVDFFVDENLRYVWFLVETIPHSLFLCQLDRPHSCRFLLNLVELERPIQILVDRNSNEFYVTSRRFVLSFEYSSSQTNYSFHYVNSSENFFYYLSSRTSQLNSIRLMPNEICSQQCFATNESSTIRNFYPFVVPNVSTCSKQRSMVRLILIVLIIVDLLVFIAFLFWLTVHYLRKSKLTKEENSLTNGSIYVVEKNVITQF